MPRVTHVKSARKDNPAVKAGESYYWWKFRYGGKRYSRTQPRQSQLTQSAYFGTLYGLTEYIEDQAVTTTDDFESLVEEVKNQASELLEETQGSLDNMPYALQEGPTGELLQERIDALEQIDSEVDYIDEFDFDEEAFEEDDYAGEEYSDEERQEARDSHEQEEKDRMEEEFNSWADDAKAALIEAVGNAIV